MKKFRSATIAFFLVVSFCSCDEELTPPAFDTITAKERLLMKGWTYDYILVGNDTFKALSPKGEPQKSGIWEAINHYHMRYDENHSYYFKAEVSGLVEREYGTGVNYQPNVGYWDLSGDGNILIHNKLQTYEKRFEILELTDKSLRIKLVGERISFLTNGDWIVIDTIEGSWTEVLVPRSPGN